MMNFFIQLDQELFLYLNRLGNQTWDSTMVFITGKWSWIPLYFLIIGGLITHFRQKAIVILLVIALTITVSDRFSSGFMKPTVKRLRPCQVFKKKNKVRILVYCGRYGFISSHASNTFALAFILSFVLRHTKYHRIISLGCFLWAFVVSYSRIYVGVHYPGDIFFGALAGLLWAFIICKIAQKYQVMPFYP